MTILFLSPYIYDSKHKEFSRNKTGFGLFVPEMATSIGAHEKVFLLAYVPTRGFILSKNFGECIVLRHSFFSAFLCFSWVGIKNGFRELWNTKITLRDRIHRLYYWLNYGYIKKTIKRIKPDIVHIQNINKPFIHVCNEIKTPYLITLHGIDGLREDFNSYLAKEEIDFIKKAYIDNVPLAVISTGIKKRIQNEYLNGKNAENIFVVPNGTNLSRTSELLYTEKKKVVVAIGSLCYRKNQIQIIEAIKQLGSKFDEYQLHLCGADMMNGELQNKVKDYHLDDRVFFHGFISPKQIDRLLDNSILNILASKDEGFGLSVIEAFSHGVPTVTFSDLDAVEDLYSEEAMLLCNNRSTSELAKTIHKALNKEWDANLIRNHANRFSLEIMATKYLAIYKTILER